MYFKILFVCVLYFVQIFAAPKPIEWRQLGERAINFGRQALPVIKTGCQLLTPSQPQYPLYQPYPQPPQDQQQYQQQYQQYAGVPLYYYQ